ncbi:hypothetical protein TNCV_179311 [Trichonephila clavipes]|nr:hypothetical protein TNCV_179311 [Trichonephila clavipes]
MISKAVAELGQRFRTNHQIGTSAHASQRPMVTYTGMGRNGHQSLLHEVETSEKEINEAREEPDEIMHINHDSESKFEKSDEHEMFESKDRFSNAA